MRRALGSTFGVKWTVDVDCGCGPSSLTKVNYANTSAGTYIPDMLANQ